MGELRKSVHHDIAHGPWVLLVLVQNSHGQYMAERLFGLLDNSENGLEIVRNLSQIFDVLLAWHFLGL